VSSWQKQGSGGALQQLSAYGDNAIAIARGAGAPASFARLVLPTYTNVTGGNFDGGIPVDGQNQIPVGGIAAGARDVICDLHSMEAGKFATEVIVTGGAGGSRSGERLTRSIPTDSVDNGRVSIYAEIQPKGARSAYGSPIRLWTIDANNYCEINPTTGVITTSVAGVTNTTDPVTWNALDTVEIFVATGASVATRASYRVNGGSETVLSITGSALAAVSAPSAFDWLCNGTASQFTSWARKLEAYKQGRKPSWVS
jgi:hypothetical protein